MGEDLAWDRPAVVAAERQNGVAMPGDRAPRPHGGLIAAADPTQGWETASRYGRRAEVVAVDRLTVTGTVRVSCRVADDGPFEFRPGHWIGIEEVVPELGVRRSPYCIMSPPGSREFELLLRVFPEAHLARHLASMGPGDPIHFRGPAGRSMVPKEPDAELVLLATGVGISPLLSLCRHLTAQGDPRRIRLYWGLRSTEDICLLGELDDLVDRHRDLSYQISLSEPPDGWPQLRGRVTESVPPLLARLGGTLFYLSGNGAMVEEMETALGTFGVDRTFIHEERFFNIRHRPDPATIDAILARFVAHDLHASGVNLATEVLTFNLHRDIHGRVVGPPE